MSPTNSYSQRLNDISKKLKAKRRLSEIFSIIRVLVFVALIALFLFVVVPLSNPLALMGGFFGGIVIFSIPLWYHQKILGSITFLEILEQLNQNEIDQNPAMFADGSMEGHRSALATDIDILGPGSLFQKINRCITPYGNTTLASILLRSRPLANDILRNQEAIKELTPLIDLRQDIIAEAYLGANKKTFRYKGSTVTTFTKPLLRSLITLWPYISALCITLGFLVHGIFYFGPFLGLYWISKYEKQLKALSLEISGTTSVWKSYALIFTQFNHHTFHAPQLVELRATTEAASNAIQQLAKISSRWEHRNNLFAQGIMNTLLLFDLKCAFEYEVWKEQHLTDLNKWLETLGQLEALCSLATFGFNHPNYTYPALTEGKRQIMAENLGHPLVEAPKVITNSICLGTDAQVYIITGSNMSGKSTFLRAVGLNMILAQAGAPVFATSMAFSPLQLLTSFRQSDSVQESTSYFFAELKRLKEIISEADHPEGTLILLDEILRGTNSEDKTYGSEALLKKLMGKNAVTLLATHDLKLGTLEEQHPGKVLNYCFESEIVNDALHFDYKIKKGVAKNKNATFLMKKMEII